MGIAACSQIPMQASTLTPEQSPAKYVLDQTANGGPPWGKNVQLKAGSSWNLIGTLPQGTVLCPLDTVVVARMGSDANAHEACLVVRDDKWGGFWLRYESAFSPLEQPTPIQLRKE